MSKYHRELSGALEFLTISEPARILIFIFNYWPLIAIGLAGFVLPYVPLALGIRMLMIPSPPKRQRRWKIATWAPAISGMFAWMLLASHSGPGLYFLTVKLAVLLTSVIQSISLYRKRTPMEALSFWQPSVVAMIACAIPLAISVASAATRLANDMPYCIAHHGPNESAKSLSELRGLSLYTTRTGYKHYHRWAYHGALIVGDPKKQYAHEYYAWQPKLQRFERAASYTLGGKNKVEGSCEPVPEFLQKLRL